MKISKKIAMSVALCCSILMSGCSSQSEEDIYGMTIEELDEKAIANSQREATEEEKTPFTKEESKELEVGTFVERMPDRTALNKVDKDFMCILHIKTSDYESSWLSYGDSYEDGIPPYPRDYYLTDNYTGEFWCIGYIIYESKVEEFKNGSYVRSLLMPEEYGDKKTKWIPVKVYDSKEDLDN